MHILEMLVYMIAAHFLLDYALQGDWMSKAKNATLDLVPGEKIWPLALFGHALIHATAVQIISGNWFLFSLEPDHPLGDGLRQMQGQVRLQYGSVHPYRMQAGLCGGAA